MSKFCMQCGTEIDDNAEICSSCGAAQTSTPDGTAESTNESKKSNAPLIAAAAVIIVILLLIMKALFGGSYKEPIDNMCKAIETGKGKYLYKCMPEFVLDEQYEDMKKSEIIDELDDEAEDMLEDMEDELGDDIKVSYKIKDKEKIDKDDLEDLEEMLEDAYDGKIKVRKGYEVDVKIKAKGDDDSDSQTMTLNVYKINGDWCIMGLGGIF
ncbi:MAG: zinc ribbon domain-containing protein [Oscillospiraceae bacterium]|nr:zinc ribbon domain-containing protein [Oscillospiraceae bacterium]